MLHVIAVITIQTLELALTDRAIAWARARIDFQLVIFAFYSAFIDVIPLMLLPFATQRGAAILIVALDCRAQFEYA